MAFVKTLPQLLLVHMPISLSNRTWFIREGIPFQPVGDPPTKPRMKLMRTQAQVALPTNWKEHLLMEKSNEEFQEILIE
jgi:hypothetical protein